MTTAYAALLVKSGPLRRERLIHALARPMETLLSWRGLFRRAAPLLHRQRLALASLNGGSCPPDRLLGWLAESIGLTFATLWGGFAVAVLSGTGEAAIVGLTSACCVLPLRTKELYGLAARRKMSIAAELPLLLNRLLLSVNAGENVGRALERCSSPANGRRHPLYDELRSALEAMRTGTSAAFALEEFGRRCGTSEARLLATVVLVNARRGGEAFTPALRDLTRRMWDQRKAAARTLGEQASSRLAFPMAVIFLVVLVLVGAPALLLM